MFGQFTLTRIRQVFPHFNERPISEHEFWRAAKKEKIIVRSLPLMVDGYYKQENGKHFILINQDLSGLKWLHTALHEFCHYLFDGCPNTEALFRRQAGDAEDPRERLADAFALIGLLPFPELVKIQHEDLASNPAMWRLVRDRITVRAESGL